MGDKKRISRSWRLPAIWLALAIAAWGQVGLVSVNSAGTAAGNAQSQWSITGGACRQRCVSSDGRFVVFTSLASDLTAISDLNSQEDVFVRDRLTGTTTLVSVNLAGTFSGDAASFQPTISADGHFVAFFSGATDLVALPVIGGDIYVRDLIAGTTTLASINSAGTGGGNGFSNRPVISADGSRVAFGSNATDLVATTDANGASRDVFVRDLTAGTTTLVSINSAGTASGNGTSGEPAISADGNRIAFESEATDLVPGFVDGNAAGLKDVFVRDLTAGTTTLVSINSAGTASGNGESGIPAISEDGSHVAYQSAATNLTALADTNGALDLLVRDLGSGTTFLATVNSAGTAAGNFGFVGWTFPGLPMSTDAKRIVFTSLSNNLVANDTNAALDVFVRDLTAGSTTLVSINSGGTASGAGASSDGFLSAAGNLVVFRSLATDLVAAPPVVAGQAYERDLTAGTTTLLSLDSAGTASAGCCASQPLLSGSGSTVGFLDTDTTLVALPDTNADIDVFAVGPIASSPSISINDVSVTEGNVGTVTAGFTVSLSAASTSTVTVDFITSGVTATSGTDFVASSGTVTFLAGQTSKPINITVNGDTLDEVNETFTVDLSNPTNATIADSQGVGTILDDDPAPTLSINDVSQAEGNAGTTNMVFTVSLSAVSGKDVSVNYLTADNTATQPSDYTLTSGTLTILAGNLSGPIPVPIVGDITGEPNETFVVNLSAPVNATILDSQGQGTIINDDPVTNDFSMSTSMSSITCTAGATAHFNITVTPATPPLNAPVNFSCSGNPPQSSCTVTPSSVTPGSSPASVEVQIHSTASSALRPLWERSQSPLYAVMLLPGLGLVGLVWVTPARSKGRRRLLEVVLLLAVSLALMTSGCGSGGAGQPGTPSGTYTVVITGTSGSTSHSTNITLTIHQ